MLNIACMCCWCDLVTLQGTQLQSVPFGEADTVEAEQVQGAVWADLGFGFGEGQIHGGAVELAT